LEEFFSIIKGEGMFFNFQGFPGCKPHKGVKGGKGGRQKNRGVFPRVKGRRGLNGSGGELGG